MMSVDGRIDCPMVDQLGGNEYYTALERLGKCSKLSGRVTAVLECSAVNGERTETPDGESVGHEAFHIAEKADEYYITVDSNGKFIWGSTEADGHPVIVIMTENVSRNYLETLKKQGISWIVAGNGKINLRRASEILHDEFNIDRIAVVGGGTICGGFLYEGLLDEISIIIGAGIDGRSGQTAVFDGIGKSDNTPYRLSLSGIEKMDPDIVWLRYKVKPATSENQ